MRAVNLLPRDLADERKPLPKMVPLVGAGAVPVIALVLVFVGYSRAHSTVSSETAQLAVVQAASTPATTAATAESAADVALSSDRTARLDALQSVLAKEEPWDTTFTQLTHIIPAGVWLTSLQAQSPTPEGSSAAPAAPAPGTAGPTNFTIVGYALSNLHVALLIQRLQLLPALANITVPTVAAASIGKTDVVSFTITATLQPPGTPPATTAPPPAAAPTSTVPAATTTTTTPTPS